MKTLVRRCLIVGGLLIGITACTPTQLAQWMDAHGLDRSAISDAELAVHADNIDGYLSAKAAEEARRKGGDLHKYDGVLSDAALARLRNCESGGNYRAVSRSGAYRGAYQFSRTTWNAVAAKHFPRFVGVDPAEAGRDVQDAMARALYKDRGRAPWPICGKRI